MSWIVEKAAAEIGDGQWVIAATPAAQAAYAMASQGHAPSALCLEPWGALRAGDEEMWLGSANEALGLLAQGRVDVAFVGAAQVDRFGNLNHSYIGHYVQPTERLPGAGLRPDLTSLARRVVVLLDEHSPQRLVEEVSYLSAAGSGTGGGWRESAGLPSWAQGVTTLITPLALFRADADGQLQLVEVAPNATPDEVRQATGWPI